MVEIQNKEILNTISEKIKESNVNVIPKQLANSIMPVIDVGANIDTHISKQVNKNTSGSATIYLTPSDKDFYITSLMFSYSKNGACDTATGSLGINVVIDGATSEIITCSVITLTAEKGDVTMTFTKPLKVDRNSEVKIAGDTFTAGVMARSASCSGFLVDTLEK